MACSLKFGGLIVIKIGEFLKNAQFKYKFNVIRCRGDPGKIGISP